MVRGSSFCEIGAEMASDADRSLYHAGSHGREGNQAGGADNPIIRHLIEIKAASRIGVCCAREFRS
jgi:hypothetical protein